MGAAWQLSVRTAMLYISFVSIIVQPFGFLFAYILLGSQGGTVSVISSAVGLHY